MKPIVSTSYCNAASSASFTGAMTQNWPASQAAQGNGFVIIQGSAMTH